MNCSVCYLPPATTMACLLAVHSMYPHLPALQVGETHDYCLILPSVISHVRDIDIDIMPRYNLAY